VISCGSAECGLPKQEGCLTSTSDASVQTSIPPAFMRQSQANVGVQRCPGQTADPATIPTERDTMFEKAGKYYADWRDNGGKRLRKSFVTKRAALQFEAEQKERANPKQQARGRTSPNYSVRGTSGSRTATLSIAPPSSSSLKLVRSNRTNSARQTSRTSTSKLGTPKTRK